MEVTNDTDKVEITPGNDEIRDPKAVLEALDRAKNDAKSYREKYEAQAKTIADLETALNDAKSSDKATALQHKVVELHVASALAAQGVPNPGRVAKYLNNDNLQLDDSYNLVGFEEELAQVKKDLPELFDKKRQVAGAADLFKNEEIRQAKTGTEAQVARLFNR